MCETRSATGEAPEGDADADEHPAGVSVGQPAEDWGEEHVGDEEGEDEPAHGGAGDAEIDADGFLNGVEDGAIDVVEEIDGQEKDEGGAGAFCGVCARGIYVGGHWWVCVLKVIVGVVKLLTDS